MLFSVDLASLQLSSVKVYVSALEGYIPTDMIRTFNEYLDFFYLVRSNTLTEDSLDAISDALHHFHHYRHIFQDTGV